ncbi:MAG: cytochrome C [Nitrospirae bacterium]|nr:cytochrome C [Nitrospirota bacterium]
MKIKFSIIMVAAIAIICGLSGTSFAFHSGGVAECEGCHSMHNSFEGTTNVTGRTFAQGTGPYLLKANDQGGTCLNCHNAADTVATSYHISTNGITAYDSTVPVEMTPGGDFAWLKKTMSFIVRGNTNTQVGDHKGHSIVAADYGYAADPDLTVAPGGTYPAGNLACSSCHDPHGRYRRDATGAYATTGLPIFNSGSYTSSKDPIAGVAAVGAYRILGGNGYLPKSLALSGTPAFTVDPMDVVVASTYNRSEATSQTGIAYGKNVAEWCANCHTGMLQGTYTSGMAGLRHPAGNGAKLTADIVANYNAYVSSGIMTNTGNAFSTLAPFATDTNDRTVLKSAATNTTTRVATTGDNVTCLSCHRAHATAFESMLRFAYSNEFMTAADSTNAAIYDSVNGKGTGYSVAQQTNAYYGRPATAFGPNARVFCNKCHAKD